MRIFWFRGVSECVDVKADRGRKGTRNVNGPIGLYLYLYVYATRTRNENELREKTTVNEYWNLRNRIYFVEKTTFSKRRVQV